MPALSAVDLDRFRLVELIAVLVDIGELNTDRARIERLKDKG